ncbi:MAG TPA: hypothetical protein VEP90_22335 [Methylomirabilota bacterium]|jgi:hypothetical protein|nr:hypothetical protein [Methylomirabilota bacterium]
MPEKEKSENTLPQELADFKQQNPKVAEAMELFGITLTKYQETLNALYGPQIYQSTSTVRVNKPNR